MTFSHQSLESPREKSQEGTQATAAGRAAIALEQAAGAQADRPRADGGTGGLRRAAVPSYRRPLSPGGRRALSFLRNQGSCAVEDVAPWGHEHSTCAQRSD